MEVVFRIVLFLAGVINFAPALIVFFPKTIAQSYGIQLTEANLELLMRHRGILFGLVGGLMIYAAIFKKYENLAVFLGTISMGAFIMLYILSNTSFSPGLTKVMRIDVVAFSLLLVAYVLHQLSFK
ncbi:MAG TPA: hypothetical protein DCS93_23220 [Microscillaceae bacterium]|nr:hypothetical protein [Microscillaceae bacterium]